MSKKRTPSAFDPQNEFDINRFLREVKIVIVEVGSIIVLAVWIWHEVVHVIAAN